MSEPRATRAVAWWLAACAALTAGMIVLGGVTRLTRAGLSITTWDPVTGVVPPLDAAGWEHAFDLYRSSPEGQVRAGDMSLAAFRSIYLVEWAHRLLGRTLGLVLLGPLVFFGARRMLPRTVALRLGLVFVAGGVQAVVGWLMVQSGLVSVPHVSPYRLTAHLVLGVALFVAMLWSALDAFAPPLAAPARPPDARAQTLVNLAAANVLLLLVWGGLMAGHHAGLVFSDFPTMGGSLVPRGTFASFGAPFGDAVTVHFAHRALALSMTALVGLLVVRTWTLASPLRHRARLLAVATSLQIALGAVTVMQHVPLVLAASHQACGLVVVALVASLQHALRSARAL